LFSISVYANNFFIYFFQGGLILEVVIAKYWANLGDIFIDYSIEFHGIHMINGNLTMLSGDGINRLELRSSLRNEEIVPNISLKASVQVLKYVLLEILHLIFILMIMRYTLPCNIIGLMNRKLLLYEHVILFHHHDKYMNYN